MGAAARADPWTGRSTSVSEIERQLTLLRTAHERDGDTELRTSMLTHLAWVPAEWEQAASDTLAGLAERHPSRAILLLPEPDAHEGGLDAAVSVRCFALPGLERNVCSEVIELRLRGRRALAPASIVAPLLIADLPVFLRWRGRPAFGDGFFEQLVDLVHRLIVDSHEWPDVPASYRDLAGVYERTAVSDIAWARTLPWRRAVAGLWPGIAGAERVEVAGPAADAHLLSGWLGSRLGRRLALGLEEAAELTRVAVDGQEVEVDDERPSGSDLLSDELDRFVRDPIYEAAASAAAAA